MRWTFNEGGNPPTAPSREEAIRYGEAGFVRFLAVHSNVPFEERMNRTFAILNTTPGLEGPPRSLEALTQVFCSRFPETASFRDAPDSWFDPVQKANVMNDLSRRSNEERNRFMVELLVSRVRQGKRVFAVVGASHVVMQERALRDALQ